MNNPQLYSETNNLARYSAKFVLEKYSKWLSWRSNETIMEFGIGTGNTTKEVVLPRIPSNFAKYIAVDINTKFVDVAKEALASEARFRCEYLDIATDQVPFAFKENFDHILSFLVMHWVKEPRRAFRNIFDMLKPGGEILLMFFDKSPIDGAQELLGKNPKWAKYGNVKYLSPYYRESDPLIACERDLKAAGINNYRSRLERMVYHFPSGNNCIEGLYSVNPVIDSVPNDEIQEYKNTYVDYALRTGGYFEEYISGRRVFGINYNLIVVYAKK